MNRPRRNVVPATILTLAICGALAVLGMSASSNLALQRAGDSSLLVGMILRHEELTGPNSLTGVITEPTNGCISVRSETTGSVVSLFAPHSTSVDAQGLLSGPGFSNLPDGTAVELKGGFVDMGKRSFPAGTPASCADAPLFFFYSLDIAAGP